MNSINKKFYFLPIILVVVISNICHAQQQHFIYIQSDNRQPFYVKLDSKILSSTTSGYAIIPKLPKANIEMQIGFPKNEFPPQTMFLNVQEDVGYSLKNFGEGKWGLFNLQTMKIVYANDKEAEKAVVVSVPESVKEKELTQQVEQKQESKDLSVASTKSLADDAPLPVPTQSNSSKENSTENITKTKEENKASSYTAVYKIKATNTVDYVDVIIDKDLVQENVAPAEVKSEIKNTEQPKPQAAVKQKTEDQKFLDIELQNPNSVVGAQDNIVKTDTVKQKSQKTVSETKLSVNSDCVAIATDDDFFNTRKAMVGKRTDEAMVTVAVKSLRKKCFSSEQIKGLGSILLEDSGRLEFFRQAYPFVSDPQNFEALSAELGSNELKNMFKAFINR